MTTYYKFPRIPHLPNSPGVSADDITLDTADNFIGKKVIVNEKMDGEVTNFYPDHYHARSIDSRHHPSRAPVKGIWGGIRYRIPEGWRIVGENVYAKHSIHYTDLDGYFYGIAVWNDRNECLSWNDTLSFLNELKIPSVPEIYVGEFDINVIMEYYNDYVGFRGGNGQEVEGFVVRNIEQFSFDEFDKNIAKYVRKGHVQTDEHWMHKQVEPNILK